MRGLRFNVVDVRANKNQVPADMLRGVAKRIAPYGWHIEMLVNLDEAGDFAPLLGSLGVPVVLGHLGYPKGGAATWTGTRAFADLLRLLDGGQCWIKLTGPYRITTAPDLPYGDTDEPARKLVAASARPHDLGHRLAACHEEEADAQRRRHGRPAGALGSRRRRCASAFWWTIRRRFTGLRAARRFRLALAILSAVMPGLVPGIPLMTGTVRL